LPLYSTSGGRALLALNSDDAARDLLGEAYQAVTDLTVRDFAGLMDRLADIRRTGLAYDREETLEGVSTMAVAIGPILGRFSISLLVPSSRLIKNEARYREEILRCKEALIDEIGKGTSRD
ncbi:IclR family transcriptional regulator, partial [Escherichia coli]|nr:IclR family transcriptional regulator [Escherichia coli]